MLIISAQKSLLRRKGTTFLLGDKTFHVFFAQKKGRSTCCSQQYN
jgi:hypothetical protein